MDHDQESIEITFNKKQLKTLIKSLFLANIVKSAYRPEEIDKTSKEEKLLIALLKHAATLGFSHWATPENKTLRLEAMKGMEIYEDIQIFEALAFWNNLAEQLAERDMEELYGDAQHLEMSMGDSLNKEMDMEKKYIEEFEENGLQNLRLINPAMN